MGKKIHKVLEIKNLTPETFILRLSRECFNFEPGQYVVIRVPGQNKGREYSIYSSINDDSLDFLIREINQGDLSRYLRYLIPGSELEIEGPKGFFILDEKTKNGNPVLFIATGTGISPFHSYIKSYPELNYQILHGVHFADEAYGSESFNKEKLILCTSRSSKGDFFGRVTYYLKKHEFDKSTIFYLCGNSDMIEEACGILDEKGVKPTNIRTEVFF